MEQSSPLKRRSYKPNTFQFVKDEARTQKLLGQNHLGCFDELSHVLREFEQNERTIVKYSALEMAIKTFEEYVRHYTQSDWSFYVHLLPTIIGWALETEFYHHPVNLLEQGEETTNELTSEYVRWLLSNAFFLNLHSLRMTFLTQKRTIGALDFSIIFKDHNALAVGRILCQLSYFYQEAQNQSLSRVIKFDRYVVMDPPDWSNDQTLVHSTVINVQSNGMEASQGMLEVRWFFKSRADASVTRSI
eukprot:TRINITY_DN4320_c0_g1_i2.p1 TRINITY_DN4320_c0_g1~~TRINITY_DN4320_c0_g1_i2.p1  ORF type:complete len:246 (-),score=39.72 TRINITY_DN4320_c0_g1_i2:268-1005(-)